MALTRMAVRRTANIIERTEFVLRAEIIRQNEQSLYVRKVNSQSRFWISKMLSTPKLKDGQEVDLIIHMHSYISPNDETIRTKLRLCGCKTDIRKLREGDEFRGGEMNVMVQEIIPTELEGLFVIKVQRLGTEEVFYARYFDRDNTGGLPNKGNEYRCCLDLFNSKVIVNPEGLIFESKKTVEYVNEDGEEVKKEVSDYYPCIDIVFSEEI